MADEEPPVGDDTASTKHGVAEVEEVEEPGVSNPLEDSENQELDTDEIGEDQHEPEANKGMLDAAEENELVHKETSDEALSHEASEQTGEDRADEHSAEPLQDEGEEHRQHPDEEAADMDKMAQYADPSKEDKDEDGDEPASDAEPDKQDEDNDEVGAYATPLSPDSALDVMKEQPAEAPEGDEADVVPDELGSTCPGVPPPPELFVDAGRDGLRTPPLESTLSNVLVIN